MSFVIGFVLGAVIASAAIFFATHPEDRKSLGARLTKLFNH